MKALAEFHFARRGWFLAVLFAALAWARHLSHTELRPMWLILLGAGALLRVYTARYIRGHSNGERLSVPDFAVSGPYAFSRHPLYLANLVTVAGLVLFANCLNAWGIAAFFCLAFVHHQLLARAEERFLADAIGEPYQGYLQVTPRWIGFSGGKFMQTDSLRAGGLQPRSGAERDSLASALRRQGANLAKAGSCAVILWFMA